MDTLPLAAFALLVPALLAGAWLPLVVGLGQGTPAGAARDTGRRLGALALGLALGGAGVALFVEPGLGLGHGVRAVTLLGVLLGSYGVWTSVPAAAKTARAVYLSVGLGAWALLSFVGGGARPDDYLARGRTLTATYAGREGYLAVIEQGNDPRLEVDGHLRGEARRNHQVMLAHLPMALHPTAKTVAVLGVATGQAARDFLDYDLSSLAAVEAEPAAAEILGRHFDGAWLDDPRVLAVQSEPQAFLRHGRELFDVITLDPGPTFRPGVGSLYAQEFYRRAGARLAPGGLFCQVLPLSYLGLDEARSIVRTFMSEFPASSLWYNTSEFLLIGAREGAPRLSRASLTRLQSQPRLAADLSFSYWGGRTEWLNRPEVLAAGFLAGPRGLALFAADGQVYGEAYTALARAAEGRLTSEEPQIVRSLEAVLDSPAVLLDDPSALSLERVLELRRTNLADLAAASLGQEAYERRRRGELANALGLASKAVQANPRNVRAQRLLGDIERERGNEEQALAAYRKALEIDPEDPTLHARLARAAGADDALAHLEEVVRLRPKDVDARLRLAQGREAAGDRGGAVADYRRALKLDPNHAETHYQLANTLSRMEETWTAMDHYGRVIELRPDFAEAYCNLAILRAGRNELDQAIALYRQAIEHDPGLVPAHYNLSIALRKAGRLEEAEAEARRTLELNPRLHAGYDHLGTVLMDQERYGEAVAMYEKALELAPDYRQARQNLEVARRRSGS